MTVRTERSEVRTKTTESQYSPVWPEQARLVSSLLYGTLFLIVKCTPGGFKKCSSSSSIFEISGKISIFLASAGSFNVKNDNCHTVANVEFAGFALKQKYTDWTVSMEMVRTAKS